MEIFHTIHTKGEAAVGRRTIKRGAGKSISAGKISSWPRRSNTFVPGPLVLFSTETGDAWLLDPADHLAARVARDGTPEHIHFEETDTNFAIGWKGNYQIDGDAFVFIDRDTARITNCPRLSNPSPRSIGLTGKFKISLNPPVIRHRAVL